MSLLWLKIFMYIHYQLVLFDVVVIQSYSSAVQISCPIDNWTILTWHTVNICIAGINDKNGDPTFFYVSHKVTRKIFCG